MQIRVIEPQNAKQHDVADKVAIVLVTDADIDCPLFRMVQWFLRDSFGINKNHARDKAVQFMREYWK